MVELGSTPPSSLPLGLPPPPIDISKEVTLVEASPKYEEVDTRTPKARGASFLKDKTFCLLSGATTQSYFGPVHTRTKQGDCIVHVGTPEVLLPTFGSRFQLDGFEGYQTTKDFSGRIRGLFQYLPLFLKRKTPSFVNGQLDGDPAISMSTQTKVRIGSVGNMDVGELKPNTEYEHPVDENGCGQNLGGLTKWINHFTCDGFCMKVSESSGDRQVNILLFSYAFNIRMYEMLTSYSPFVTSSGYWKEMLVLCLTLLIPRKLFFRRHRLMRKRNQLHLMRT